MPNNSSTDSPAGTLNSGGDKIAALLAANPNATDQEVLRKLLAEYGVNPPDALSQPDSAAPDNYPDTSAAGLGGFADTPGNGSSGPPLAGQGAAPDMQAGAQNLLDTLGQNSQATVALLEKILQLLQAQTQSLADFDKRLTDLAGQIKSLKNP